MKPIQLPDHDPYDYCPVKLGVGPSSAIVPKLGKSTNLAVIEKDPRLETFIRSKFQVVEEHGKDKFYQNRLGSGETLIATMELAKYLKLAEPGRPLITRVNDVRTVDMFDRIAMNCAEDIVIMQLENGIPIAKLLHIHHPNGWSANGWVGKDFAEIHEDVKHRNEKQVLPQANKMAAHFCKTGGKFERVGAISFRGDCHLNRHPELPSPINWDEDYKPETSPLYMRFERQTIIGMPEIDAFMFTIKTYFCDVFKPERREQMINAFENVHTDAYARWYLDEYRDAILKRLKGNP